MSDFNISEEELREKIQGKSVVIWGAGECASQFIERNSWIVDQIKYFVDRDKAGQNKKFFGKDILSLDHLLKETGDICCLLASQYYADMLEKLNESQFFCEEGREAYNAFYMNYSREWMDTSVLDEHMAELKEILSDEESKRVVDAIREHRRQFNIDYRDVQESAQYFVEDIVRREEDAVFVDAGAYDGDTAKRFFTFQKDLYEEIYCFEMDARNYEKLKRNLPDRDNICLLNCGLWDREQDMGYSSNDTYSAVGEPGEGDMVARCVSLDGVLDGRRVSFIKMDIEGAEIPALHGAKRSILKWKPQLAICIYHKPDDLWQIPLLIHEWVPEYKIYIRHHSDTITETVLYAV